MRPMSLRSWRLLLFTVFGLASIGGSWFDWGLQPMADAAVGKALRDSANSDTSSKSDNLQLYIDFPKGWKAKELRNHPLIGRIWSRKKNDFIDEFTLVDDIATADYLLLGEVHDNPDAHRLQAWVLTQYVVMHRALKPAVVMEMLNEAQQPALDKFLAALPPDDKGKNGTGRFFDAVGWGKSGWPDAEIYAPIIYAALYWSGHLFPASAARSTVRDIGKNGFAKLSEKSRKALHLNETLTPSLVSSLTSELKEGHCNLLPERMIPTMLKVQRFRDAKMADAMVKAGQDHGAILIAGNGHVRLDRAVPWYLRRMQPGKSILTISMLEVRNGETSPDSYVPRDPDGKPAVDFVIFTPRQTRPDQCEELRKMFKKKKTR